MKRKPDQTFWKSMGGEIQYTHPMYPAVILAKIYFMNEVVESIDQFDSDYLIWIDAGITHVDA
jgi:hypothetical protein